MRAGKRERRGCVHRGPHFCVPSARARPDGTFFGDTTCSEELVRVPACESGAVIEVRGTGDVCSGTPPARYLYSCPASAEHEDPLFILRSVAAIASECDFSSDVATVHRVGERYEGPTFSPLGGCRPTGTAGGVPRAVQYRLGPEVDPATFPEILEEDR